MRTLRKATATAVILGLLLPGAGCCYQKVNLDQVAPPEIVTEITVRQMMDLLGVHFRGIVPRGTTIDQYEKYQVTTLAEYQRGISELLYTNIDPYVALGRLREWCPNLAVGLVWDTISQTHRLVVLAGLPFQFYFFSFETLRQIPRPGRIYYVIM